MALKKLLYLVFFVIVLSSFVNATNYIRQSHNYTFVSNINDTTERGMVYCSNYNQVLYNISMDFRTEANRLYIANGTVDGKVILSYCAVIGNTCILNFNMTANTCYRLGLDRNGTKFIQYYKGSASLPITDSRGNWTTATYWGGASWANDTTFAWGITEFYIAIVNASLPVITTSQNPSNFSYQSVINNNNSVTAEITDVSGINTSSIYLNIFKTDLNVYINGTLQPFNYTKTYTNTSGNFYTWQLIENDILGSTENLNTELFENSTHSYSVLSGSNSWLKIEFLNVSNYANLNILEYMSNNDTPLSSTSTYYYCNSSYFNGNPTSNSNCVLVASVDNNAQFNHTHNGGFSKHKIFSLVNIGGYIGNVKITPISYILKRGTITGDRYYYLNITSRQNATQLSNNNGNVWTSQPFTVDSHIHFIYNTSVFSYRVCATNLLGYSACSDFVNNNIILFPLNPSPVTIYNPVSGNYYTDLITINHSLSFQPMGSISIYKYYYSVSGLNTWINFYNNSITTYDWVITSLLNKAYDLRIDAIDNFNLISSSYVIGFNINNSLTSTEILLNEINNNINKNQQATTEAIKMIAISLFMTVLLVSSILIILFLPDFRKIIGMILLEIWFIMIPVTIGTTSFINDIQFVTMFNYFSMFGVIITPILVILYVLLLILNPKDDKPKNKNMYDIYN